MAFHFPHNRVYYNLDDNEETEFEVHTRPQNPTNVDEEDIEYEVHTRPQDHTNLDEDAEFEVHARPHNPTNLDEDIEYEVHTRPQNPMNLDEDSDFEVHTRLQNQTNLDEDTDFEVYTRPQNPTNLDEDIVYYAPALEDNDETFEVNNMGYYTDPKPSSHKKKKKKPRQLDVLFNITHHPAEYEVEYETDEDDDNDIVYYGVPDGETYADRSRDPPVSNSAHRPNNEYEEKVYMSKLYPDIEPLFTEREIHTFHKQFYEGCPDDVYKKLGIPKKVGTFSAQAVAEGCGPLINAEEADSYGQDSSPSTKQNQIVYHPPNKRIFVKDDVLDGLPNHGYGIDVELDGSEDADNESDEFPEPPNPGETYEREGLRYVDLSKERTFFESQVQFMFEDYVEEDVNRVATIVRKFYEEALVKICNIFLPSRLKVRNLSSDLCDGVRIHAILTELGAELGELPYPKPRNYEERVANNEVWGELFNGQPPRIEDGNLSVTMHVLTAVFNHFYLAQVTYKDQKGWPALHAFFTRYNVGLNFPQFFEKMIDHPANLREIIEMEFPAINSELNKMDNSDTEEFEVLEEETASDLTPPQDLPSPEQVLQPPRTKSEEDEINEEMFEGEVFAFNEDLQECMKLFEVHFGIPQILHPDFGVLTAEERAHRFKPYLFLQCMYGAFILNRAVKGKPSKGTRQTAIKSPKDHINYMLRKYLEMEKYGTELTDISAQYYNSIQDQIKRLNKYLLMVTQDTANNKDILEKSRSLVSVCMTKKMDSFPKITLLTAKLQSLAHIWNKETVVIVHQRHSLLNLDKCFNTLLALHRKIVQKARSADTLKLQGYQRELERKISMIHYWVKRWDNTTNDIDTARYNAPILAMRHKLLEKFNKEAKHMDSELEIVELLNNTLMKEEVISQEDKCANEDRFRGILEEVKQLKEKIEDAKQQFKKFETEARELDSLYLEKATLTQKIDAQLREFYQFFSYRPPLKSTKEFNKMKRQVQRANQKLAEVALEIDAVLSITEIHEKCCGKLPTNFYTSHKDEDTTSHWENTLTCATEMDAWLTSQRRITSQLDDMFTSKLESELSSLATDMRDQLAAISKEGSGLMMDERRLSNMKTRVERAASRLMRNRENKVHEIFDLARPLHENGIMTPRILDMMECWDNCMLTLQILQDDIEHLLKLVNTENNSNNVNFNMCIDELLWENKSTLLKSMDDYFSMLGCRVIVPRHHLKVSEQEQPVIAPLSDQDFQFKTDIPDQLLTFSNKVDPYGRVSCSMWLDILQEMRGGPGTPLSVIGGVCSAGDTTLSTTHRRRDYLVEQFSLLADNKPFLTEEVLRELLAPRGEELLSFALKHVSEFFGWEAQELAKKGVKCYDLKRFVYSLLGLHRRLSVNPN